MHTTTPWTSKKKKKKKNTHSGSLTLILYPHSVDTGHEEGEEAHEHHVTDYLPPSPGLTRSVLVLASVEEEALPVPHRVHLEAPALAEVLAVLVQAPDDGALEDGGLAVLVPGLAELLAHRQALHQVEEVLVRGADVAHEVVGVALTVRGGAPQGLDPHEGGVDLLLPAARALLEPGAVLQVALHLGGPVVEEGAVLLLLLHVHPLHGYRGPRVGPRRPSAGALQAETEGQR